MKCEVGKDRYPVSKQFDPEKHTVTMTAHPKPIRLVQIEEADDKMLPGLRGYPTMFYIDPVKSEIVLRPTPDNEYELQVVT